MASNAVQILHFNESKATVAIYRSTFWECCGMRLCAVDSGNLHFTIDWALVRDGVKSEEDEGVKAPGKALVKPVFYS
jgi:hypothetical protein